LVLILLEQILLCVEVIVAGVFDSVFGAAFEPLAPLIA
jgi:hypothetical protein